MATSPFPQAPRTNIRRQPQRSKPANEGKALVISIVAAIALLVCLLVFTGT